MKPGWLTNSGRGRPAKDSERDTYRAYLGLRNVPMVLLGLTISPIIATLTWALIAVFPFIIYVFYPKLKIYTSVGVAMGLIGAPFVLIFSIFVDLFILTPSVIIYGLTRWTWITTWRLAGLGICVGVAATLVMDHLVPSTHSVSSSPFPFGSGIVGLTTAFAFRAVAMKKVVVRKDGRPEEAF